MIKQINYAYMAQGFCHQSADLDQVAASAGEK